jgi:hypothetical protein
VLGTVVTIALGVFGGDRDHAARPLKVELPEPLATRVRARAKATGQNPTELVVKTVTRYVESADA